LAAADDSGRVMIRLPAPVHEPVTSFIQRQAVVVKDGKPEQQTYYEPVTQYRRADFAEAGYAKGIVRAFDPSGQPIEERVWLEILKGKPRQVVVTPDPASIDPAFVEVLKPGTLILVLPT